MGKTLTKPKEFDRELILVDPVGFRERKDTIDLLAEVTDIRSEADALSNLVYTIFKLINLSNLIPEHPSIFKTILSMHLTAASTSLYHLLELQIPRERRSIGSQAEKKHEKTRIKLSSKMNQRIRERVRKLSVKLPDAFDNSTPIMNSPDWLRGKVPIEEIESVLNLSLRPQNENHLPDFYEKLCHVLKAFAAAEAEKVNQMMISSDECKKAIFVRSTPPILPFVGEKDFMDERLAPEILNGESPESEDVSYFLLMVLTLLKEYIDSHHNVRSMDTSLEFVEYLQKGNLNVNIDETFEQCKARLVVEIRHLLRNYVQMERLLPHLKTCGLTTSKDMEGRDLTNTKGKKIRASFGEGSKLSQEMLRLVGFQLLHDIESQTS